jgi:hypothetical protein
MGLFGTRRRRTIFVIVAITSMLLSTYASGTATASDSTPGTKPSAITPQARTATLSSAAAASAEGLRMLVNERGRLSRSIAGVTSDTTGGGTVTIRKPAGATVRGAYFAVATTGFTATPLTEPLTIDGQPVALDNSTPTGIQSYNYFTEVTSAIKPKIDAAPAGPVSLLVAEPQPNLIDGEVLVVVFNDPAVSVDQTVTILYGALSPTGDQYGIQLDNPISLADPNTRLEMSLGISYSNQENGTQQYSTVDVNGTRLSTAAGGEDDGQPHNGALLTVGGEGDTPTNPSSPQNTPTGPRSDDELYDLRPFVHDGDTNIRVQTNNPSLDDNVFLATFAMNPPVKNIVTGSGRFVYVALGDSYQAGEGAGFDIRPSADYKDKAYENGSNYPAQVGSQDDTYTTAVSANGDSCHRALLNYAKINRDKLKPAADVVLIDRTCSGALIERSGKPAIVGKVGDRIDPESQIQQSLGRLQAQGLSASDVDLVTIGMGGNDAKFGDIVLACVLPAVLTEALNKYPNKPAEINALSGINSLIDYVNCERVDKGQLGLPGPNTDAAIAALAAKEVWAQQQILTAYPNARVLQVDYPSILPASKSPAWCGGIRGSDVQYARTKVKKINDAVRTSIAQTSRVEPRLELTEAEPTFGRNALCPAKDADRLANGVSKAAFDAEVARLLNLNGNGDKTARAEVDAVVTAYRAWRSCVINQANPFDGSSCNTTQKWNEVAAKASDALSYLGSQNQRIFANLVSPPGTSDDSVEVGFDRSRGLFHPNGRGAAVLACDVLNTYNDTSTDGCVDSASPSLNTINGTPFGNSPVLAQLNQLLHLVVNGFRANSLVRLRLFSSPIDLGEVTADAEGVVTTTVRMPAALNPGVHRLQLEGQGAGDVQVTRQALLRVPGRPTGEYTTYLCCFSPEPERIEADASQEHVTVTVGGVEIATLLPDEDGGVLVHVPSVERLRDPSALVIEARSDLTGATIRELVNPIPSAPSLWATSSGDNAVNVAGSGFEATGRVHSEGGLRIRGSGTALRGGTEYGTRLDAVGGSLTVQPPAARVAQGQGSPPVPDIADYRPGGTIATSGVPYTAIAPKACLNGVWTPTAQASLTGIVYVPCAVLLTGSGQAINATLVAEGTITIEGSRLTIGTDVAGRPSLLSAARSQDAVRISGPGITLIGTAYAPLGTVRVTGSDAIMRCGVVAASISIEGSRGSAPMSHRCLVDS